MKAIPSIITKKQYFITGLTLFVLGIVIVKFFNDSFIRPVVGDYLVVLFQYCILRVITKFGVWKSAIIVLLFSYFIEISQHFNLLEVLEIKQNLATDLIVGSTFDWLDMLAYSLAFGTIIFFENFLTKKTEN